MKDTFILEIETINDGKVMVEASIDEIVVVLNDYANKYKKQVIENSKLTDINDKLSKNLDKTVRANHEAAKEINALRNNAILHDNCVSIMAQVDEARHKQIANLRNELNELKAQKLAE